MRIISAPDGAINRYDRAIWVTIPFDLALSRIGRTILVLSDRLSSGLDIGVARKSVLAAATNIVTSDDAGDKSKTNIVGSSVLVSDIEVG